MNIKKATCKSNQSIKFLNKKRKTSQQIESKISPPSRKRIFKQTKKYQIQTEEMNLKEKIIIKDYSNFNNLPHKNLKFEVESWSSYISTFHPRNILLDSKSSGQMSKWSVDFKSQNEFLYLKLEKTAIVKLLTFGKFKDPTNLKEFKVFVGLDKDHLIEVAHSGLSQEEGYEAFTLRHKTDDCLIPCNWIKIVPIRPWNDSYNISIWFVNLKGVDDPHVINCSVKDYQNKIESEALCNWLALTRKHFKLDSMNLLETPQVKSRIESVEDKRITDLYKSIMQGEYEECETIVNTLERDGLFKERVNYEPYSIQWTKVDLVEKEIERMFEVINHNGKLYKDEIIRKSDKTKQEGEQILAPSQNRNNINNTNSITFIGQHETNNNHHLNNRLNIEISNTVSNSNNISNNDPPRNALLDLFSDINPNLPSLSNTINRGPSNIIGNNSEEDLGLNESNDSDASNEIDLESELSGYSMFSDMDSVTSVPREVEILPKGRGGHSMTLDEEGMRLYLFGGWDGTSELDDFWYYDLSLSSWHAIAPQTYTPSARSCHKTAIDSSHRRILLYGKYSPAGSTLLETSIYCFDLNLSKWTENATTGGPGQVYDHSLVYEREANCLYLFGGCRVGPLDSEGKYSGLWKLDLNNYNWESLSLKSNDDLYEMKLKPRCAHSMVINDNRELIILGGNKGPALINTANSFFDMVIYDIKTGAVREVLHDYSKAGGPHVNFSFGSFYKDNQLFVFGGGLISDKGDQLTNNFWVYNFTIERWSLAFPFSAANYDLINLSNNFYSESKKIFGSNEPSNSKICNLLESSLNKITPRYAHSIVYSTKLSRGFVFGGNANLKNYSVNSGRLDDFWSFSLTRRDSNSIVQDIKRDINSLFYSELIQDGKFKKAIEIIKTKLQIYSDQKLFDSQLEDEFIPQMLQTKNISEEQIINKRYELFERIMVYLPKYLYCKNTSSSFLNNNISLSVNR